MYAIRQKSTGYYLPQIKRKKGYTHTVPEKDCLPRLFKRRSDASNALNKWLQGKSSYVYIGGNFVEPPGYEMLTVECKDRDRDDMQIVQCILFVDSSCLL